MADVQALFRDWHAPIPESYHPHGVDVAQVPDELTGFRTMFTSFHQLRPEAARAVLVAGSTAPSLAAQPPFTMTAVTWASTYKTLASGVQPASLTHRGATSTRLVSAVVANRFVTSGGCNFANAVGWFTSGPADALERLRQSASRRSRSAFPITDTEPRLMGVANPRAQGHAMISTATALVIANPTGIRRQFRGNLVLPGRHG